MRVLGEVEEVAEVVELEVGGRHVGDGVLRAEARQQVVDPRDGADAGRGGRGSDDDHVLAGQGLHEVPEAALGVARRLVVVVEAALDHDEVGSR